MADTIDIYDFDHTIYDGDASLDFYLYCLRKQPLLGRYLPLQLFHAGLFLVGLEKRLTFKNNYFRFLRGLRDVSNSVEGFWEANFRKLKSWYHPADHGRDIIVSASPEFLLAPVAARLKAYALIATRVDTKTGVTDGNNCRGQEKVRRLRESFPDIKIGSVYTDNLVDQPLLDLGAKHFIVKGNTVRQLKD